MEELTLEQKVERARQFINGSFGCSITIKNQNIFEVKNYAEAKGITLHEPKDSLPCYWFMIRDGDVEISVDSVKLTKEITFKEQ